MTISRAQTPKQLTGGRKKKKDTSKLTVQQKETLKKHAVHHTSKHMSEMRKAMRKGRTFTAAHKQAMKKVGT